MATRFGAVHPSADWISRQPERRRVLPTYTRPVRGEGFYNAPGWREVEMTFCLGEGESYRDPAVTRAIREFDPDMIPIWVRWVFMSPQEGDPQLEVFGRHAIGRFVRNAHYEHEPIPVGLVPMGFRGPLPNQLDLILEGDPDPRGADLPGKFQPWDWSLFYRLKRAYNVHRAMTVAELKSKVIYEPQQRREKELEQMRDEFEYRARDVRSYAQKQLDKVSEVEAKEWALGGKLTPRSRPTYSKPGGVDESGANR